MPTRGDLLVTLLTLTGTISWFSIGKANQEETLFKQWAVQNNKVYADSEYNVRLDNFKTNLKRIDELNRKNPKAIFAVNKFSDLSEKEFKETVLMKSFDADNTCIWPYSRLFPTADTTKKPATFDWTTKPGVVSAVKNQASCGSCWTFSTAENIEGQWALSKKLTTAVSLSEQWIVDCSHACLQSEPDLCNGGCGGGLPWLAYADIITNHGLTDEADYAYTGYQGTCQTGKPVDAVISNWKSVSTDVDQIETVLSTQGPLSITLNAGLLMSYSSGIITGDDDDCPNSGSDHAVLLVGYDDSQQFWKVKNSWGTDWGEQGFFRIQNNGLCGTNACVTTATI